MQRQEVKSMAKTSRAN